MEAIRNIGKMQVDKLNNEGKGLLEVFTEDPSGGGNYNVVFEILISKNNNDFKYSGINKREYDSTLKEKYLYKAGASNGTDITPTSKITDVNKTFNKKIIKAMGEAVNIKPKEINMKETTKLKYDAILTDKEIIKSMYNAILTDKDLILKDLEEKIKDMTKKDGSFLTVCLLENDLKKYIGDFELFKYKIVNDTIKNYHYSITNKKDVRKDNAVCSLCHQECDEVYGLVGVFPFYTIDKIGYISGGFNYEKAWRNFPVCKSCAVELEAGKEYLDKNLTFSFYGRKYYLIPKPIYEKDLKSILKKYLILKSENVADVRNKFSSTEESVLRILNKEESAINFDLMFIEKNNAALNILLNIEDVSPSRFKKIFNALDDIRDMEFFKEKPVSFDLVNNVFPRDIYNRYFLDVIDKIISNTKIDYKFLMQFFNNYIIESFKLYENDEFSKEKDSYSKATFRVFGFLYFLQSLNLFKERKENVKMDMENKTWDIKNYVTIKRTFEAFFDESTPFFNIPDKKAVFLMGYLVKKLLNIQYIKEKRKPFIPRLKSLKLNSKDIQRLMPEVQGKLTEYKSEFYSEEFKLLSHYFIESENLNNLSELDIPFYFSLGMNMDKDFVTSTKEEENLNEEEILDEAK